MLYYCKISTEQYYKHFYWLKMQCKQKYNCSVFIDCKEKWQPRNPIKPSKNQLHVILTFWIKFLGIISWIPSNIPTLRHQDATQTSQHERQIKVRRKNLGVIYTELPWKKFSSRVLIIDKENKTWKHFPNLQKPSLLQAVTDTLLISSKIMVISSWSETLKV